VLGGTDSGAYQAVAAAAASAGSVRELVEAVSGLDGLPDDIQREVRAVFDALPPDVDRGLLNSLRSALERGDPVEVAWEEIPQDQAISHRVEQRSEGGARIVLLTPHGRHFTS
jgi:hypothetical protein